jgi:hypothetical protein
VCCRFDIQLTRYVIASRQISQKKTNKKSTCLSIERMNHTYRRDVHLQVNSNSSCNFEITECFVLLLLLLLSDTSLMMKHSIVKFLFAFLLLFNGSIESLCFVDDVSIVRFDLYCRIKMRTCKIKFLH